MHSPRITSQSRQALDKMFELMRPLDPFKPPVYGWIKAIREALGMSSAQLAKHLKIKQPTLTALEQSELKGTIRLGTLRRVAEALDCTLVYALVPNKPLDQMVKEQARKIARRQLRAVEHSMLLERQEVPRESFEDRIDALAAEISPRSLWDEP
jgi:predicted DNA-binding mobile mystery protein A